MAVDVLKLFHPGIRRWFVDRFGAPTEAQSGAWPRIAAGENVLLSAPTGTGKTLAAFLWAIDRLARQVWDLKAVRVLYVSPLRALNNDIRRNLIAPLDELRETFAATGEQLPMIRAATRSGDTPQSERRRMLREPPEILITTPESLNVLLTSGSGSDLLSQVETVILDEVHAVADGRRGTHLITAVERLVRLSGEFQRVALSATVRPLARVAQWVGGFQIAGSDERGQPRPVTIVDAAGPKAYEMEIRYLRPESGWPDPGPDGVHPVWSTVASAVDSRVTENRSTLVFANSRGTVERLARLVNGTRDEPLVYSHHGSLSREIREVVEERLKAGQLRGIVATNTLELGIDVGAIDEVVLVGTPRSIASAVQRVGRAGHRVGQVSRAMLYPVHSRDVIDAAVTVQGLFKGDVEPISPPEAPLDVMAQVVLSMAATEEWDLDELFEFLRTTDPYRDLSRQAFDLVIEMLAGRYSGTRIPELRARLTIDRASGTIRARPGTARLLYAAGGTIPDRGYFTVRLADTRTPVGELDEEFVWERSEGEEIVLGVQTWRIKRIGWGDVLVNPSRRQGAKAPFWKAENQARSLWFAERMGGFLEWVDERIDSPELTAELEQHYHLDRASAAELLRFATAQRQATGASLPHRRHLVVEQVAAANPGRPERPLTVLHTVWGGRVNRALGVVLGAAINERLGVPVETTYDDGCVVLELPEAIGANELFGAVEPEDAERLLRSSLQNTGLFGARFRECAGRALLLPRTGFGRRTPLWQSRQRAKELLAAVSQYGDFPILLETWRTCLAEEMDLEGLVQLLTEVATEAIAVSEVVTDVPSPFTNEALYRRTNALMYEDDKPLGEPGGPRPSLLEQVVFSPGLRPRIPLSLVESLEAKLQRVHPGYTPRNADEICDWLGERVLMPPDEWRQLLDATERDHGLSVTELLTELGDRVVAIGAQGDGARLVCACQDVLRIRAATGLADSERIWSAACDGSPASEEAVSAIRSMERQAGAMVLGATDSTIEVLAEWLGYYGPADMQRIRRATGMGRSRLDDALTQLERDSRIVIDTITEKATEIEICDAGNLARLLRLSRAASRPVFEPRPASTLPLFLATRQGLGQGTDKRDLQLALDRMLGLPLSAASWEEEILPARVDPYRSSWLDALIAETDLMWFGCGAQRLAFALEAERELCPVGGEGDTADENESVDPVLPHLPGRFSTADLLTARDSLETSELIGHLWDLAWKGLISNDSFAAVRQGVASGFQAAGVKDLKHPRRRFGRGARLARWRPSQPLAGAWYRLPPLAGSGDALAIEELRRDRVRLLLERYGVLFRSLLSRELPGLRWDELFRTLRVLELAGEVIGGRFFEGVAGLQFIAPDALRMLSRGLDEDRVFWQNATDPVCACGLGVDGLDLPRRVATTHLVFHGRQLVLVAERSGRKLDLRCSADDPRLAEYLHFMEVSLSRDVRPLRVIPVEEINGRPAAESEYREAFERLFDVEADHRTLRLRRPR